MLSEASRCLGLRNFSTILSQCTLHSTSGGKAAAIAYTLIETARLNDVDPQAWLAQILERISEYKIDRIDQLLPWNTAPAENRDADACSRKGGQTGHLPINRKSRSAYTLPNRVPVSGLRQPHCRHQLNGMRPCRFLIAPKSDAPLRTPCGGVPYPVARP